MRDPLTALCSLRDGILISAPAVPRHGRYEEEAVKTSAVKCIRVERPGDTGTLLCAVVELKVRENVCVITLALLMCFDYCASGSASTVPSYTVDRG